MNGMNGNDSQNEKNLDSAEYRAKLLRKLNTLISVLDVALSKVRVNLNTPGSDLERLTRIRLNLENTLNVCRRAKLALEKRQPMPAGLTGDLAKFSAPSNSRLKPKKLPQAPKIGPDGMPQMSYRDYVELSSLEEYKKFKQMPPIKKEELAKIDWDSLAKKVGGTDELA